jgi:DNA-directed RNA polymerase specialized sigma24 family protein
MVVVTMTTEVNPDQTRDLEKPLSPRKRDLALIAELEKLSYLKVSETALVLGVSVRTLDIEMKSGRLEIIQMGTRGRARLITKAARERWAAKVTGQWVSSDAL